VKKRFISLILVACVVFSMLTMVEFDVSAESYSGSCGENVTWSLDTVSGILTISGTGAMYGYNNHYGSSPFTPWNSYKSFIKGVIINQGVTVIGECAFYGCSNLEIVTIPNSITVIGSFAFYNCQSLSSITIPEGVKGIGSYAFYYCKKLKSITIPISVTEIAYCAFSECTGLESIALPFAGNTLNGTTNMHFGYIFGAKTFYDNQSSIPSSLKTVVITNGTKINSDAFYECSSLTSITIPDSVTSIGYSAFENCESLTSFTLPDKLEIIGGNAFSNCYKLASITIPEGVTDIGGGAFSYCSSLTSITIPKGVTDIGGGAFSGCVNIRKVNISDISAWCKIKFGSETANPLYYAYKLYLNDVLVTDVTFPNNITSVGNYAFYNCISLTSVTVPKGIEGIGISAFCNCNKLTSISIPDSIKSIEYSAFSNCSKLTDIVIPDGVTSIGTYAFSDCSSLINITIPESAESVGAHAFDGCNNIKYNVYDNANYLGDKANPYFLLIKAASTDITSCEINPNTKIIYYYAFKYCNKLKSLTVPESVKSIDAEAFWGCKGLESLKLSYGLKSIDKHSFNACDSLKSVVIPDSVTSIGIGAFSLCKSLESITLPFLGNTPNGTTGTHFGYIFGANFYSDNSSNIPSSLKTVVITKDKRIDSYAFYGCNKIESLTIPRSVETIGGFAFTGCNPELTIYCYKNSFAHRYAKSYSYAYVLINKVFPDVTDENAWYYEPIMYVTSYNIFSGYSSGYFGLSDNIQRQDFLVALARYSGENYNSYTTGKKFKDVSSGTYYTNAVNWGSTNGIVSGYQNGTFGVGDNITREQLVLFFYRYAKYAGYDVSVTTTASYWKSKYSDFNAVSDWARDAVIWALEKGVISGKNGKYIDPQGNAQRCEVAKIFYNIDTKNVFSK